MLALTLAPALLLAALPHRGWIDFYQIVTGADALWAGHNPYFWQYHNPPWFAVMLGPLLLLPYDLLAEVWFWLNLAALLGALWLWMPAAGIPRRSLAAATLASAAVVFAPTVHNLIHGQSTLLTVLALVVLAIAPGRNPALAGAALTMLTVKPQVGGLLLLAIGVRLLARRDWPPLLWAVGLLGGLTAAALVLRPTALHEWVSSLTNGSLVTTGSPAIYHLLREAGLGVGAGIIAGLVSVAAVTLLLQQAWRGHDRGVDAELVSMGILASLLAAPYSHSYDYVVLLLPALLTLGQTFWPEHGRESSDSNSSQSGDSTSSGSSDSHRSRLRVGRTQGSPLPSRVEVGPSEQRLSGAVYGPTITHSEFRMSDSVAKDRQRGR